MWETPTVILADTHFDLGYIFLRLRVILINLPSNFTARLTYFAADNTACSRVCCVKCTGPRVHGAVYGRVPTGRQRTMVSVSQ